MRKLLSLCLFVIIFCCQLASAGTIPLEETLKAACRISVSYVDRNIGIPVNATKYGSGTVVDYDEEYYYILTNGHVTKDSKAVKVEFFDDGYVTKKIDAKLVWEYYVKNTSVDASILSVSKSDLNNYQPRVVPIAPRGTIIKKGTKIYGAGCPAARWDMAWEAIITDVDDTTIAFNMPPEGGQSGSGVIADVNGKPSIVGLVTWRVKDDFGAGVSINRLYQMIDDNIKDTNPVNVDYKVIIDCVAKENEGWETVPEKRCKNCGLGIEHHIKSDGTHQLHCELCTKHRLTYKQHIEQGYRCGPYGCFPYADPSPVPPPQKPQPPNGGKIGRVPPNIKGDSGDNGSLFPNRPTAPTPPTDDSAKIKELETKISELEKQNTTLDRINKELQAQIDQYKKQIQELKDNNSTLAKEKGVAQAEAEGKGSIIERLKSSGFKENWLDGITGGNGNVVENTSIALISLLTGSLLLPWLSRKIGVIPARLLIWAAKKGGEKIIEKKLGKSDEIKDSVYNNSVDEVVATSQETPQPKPQSNVKVNNAININQRGQDFFSLKEVQGEKKESWFIKGVLYREAVDRLRQGLLEYSPGIKLIGQEKTANAIDKYVRSHFLARLNSYNFDQVTKDDILREAIIGYLYEEAVGQLRKGKFNIFNPIEIADALDDWVNRELIKFIEGTR